jgi:hypothetical protein
MRIVVVYSVDRYRRFGGRLRRLVSGFPQQRTGFDARSGHVEFVVDEVKLGRFSPSTSVSPANFHSTDYSTLMSSGAGTVVGPVEADVPSGLSLNSSHEIKKKFRREALLLFCPEEGGN